MAKQGLFKKEMSSKKKSRIQCLLTVIPFLIFIFMFSYVPLFGWFLAFCDYKPGQLISQAEFVGVDHFIKLFHDSDIMRVVRNTLVMSFLNILSSPLPIAFAIMLNDIQNVKVKKVVQTVTTLPNFISWIVVFGLVFSLFSSQGVISQLCEMLHIPYSQFGLLGDVDSAWGFQLFLGIWKSLGWNTIIYMAAITGIDMELYDAAKVDGANKFQTIRYITVPGLMPTYLVLLLLAVSNILSNGFEQYYVFWNTLTADKIETLDFYVYKLAFRTNQYSYSIALGMLKTLLGILLLFVVNSVSKKVRGSSLV